VKKKATPAVRPVKGGNKKCVSAVRAPKKRLEMGHPEPTVGRDDEKKRVGEGCGQEGDEDKKTRRTRGKK